MNELVEFQRLYTSPEQIKKLLVLGIPEGCADCYRKGYVDNTYGEPEIIPCYLSLDDLRRRYIDNEMYVDNVFPCWSAGRLVEIIDNLEGPATLGTIPTPKYVREFFKINYTEYLVNLIEIRLKEDPLSNLYARSR